MPVYKNITINESFIQGCNLGYNLGQITTLYSFLQYNDLQQKQPNVNYLSYFKQDNNIEIIMDYIMTKYNVLNKNSVQKFLSNNPDILNTINDIYDKINQYFIEIQKISLEVFNDVETNNESLLIRVLTTLGVESACKYLDKFDEDYFAEKFIELNSRVNITLDF